MSSANRIKGIRKRLEKVSDGHWFVGAGKADNREYEGVVRKSNHGNELILRKGDIGGAFGVFQCQQDDWNLEFAAHARGDIEWLLVQLELAKIKEE